MNKNKGLMNWNCADMLVRSIFHHKKLINDMQVCWNHIKPMRGVPSFDSSKFNHLNQQGSNTTKPNPLHLSFQWYWPLHMILNQPNKQFSTAEGKKENKWHNSIYIIKDLIHFDTTLYNILDDYVYYTWRFIYNVTD